MMDHLKITVLFGIAYGCPKGIRNNDCPFLEIGDLSLKEKLVWIEKLDNDKKEALLRHHSFCTKMEKTKLLFEDEDLIG